MHTRKLYTTLAVAMLTAAALAGCGGSSTNGVESKSPAEIVAAAQKAAEGAKSVLVTGSVASAGTQLALNLQILRGKGAKGTISQGPLSFELVRIGESVYIKGSAAFYKHFAGSEAAKLLQGRWLKAPASSAEFVSLISLTDMHKLFTAALGPLATFSKGGTSKIRGQKVVAIKDNSKGGVLYVATTGRPYPIQIARTGTSGGKVDFENWNAPVSISAPANSIDITKLKAGA